MSRKTSREANISDLLRDLIIVQSGLSGVSGSSIREIVGGDMNRVTKILKLLKKKSKPPKSGPSK
jgi:hypothetical protein